MIRIMGEEIIDATYWTYKRIACETDLGRGMAEESEIVEMLKIPFAEALNMLGRGKIKDAKTIILLQYEQIERLFDEKAGRGPPCALPLFSSDLSARQE